MKYITIQVCGEVPKGDTNNKGYRNKILYRIGLLMMIIRHAAVAFISIMGTSDRCGLNRLQTL